MNHRAPSSLLTGRVIRLKTQALSWAVLGSMDLEFFPGEGEGAILPFPLEQSVPWSSGHSPGST